MARRWSRWLSRRPLVLFLATIIAYVGLVVLIEWGIVRWGGSASSRWSEVIYFVTGVILIWYTVETHGLRREAARQGKLAVMPFVLARLEGNPPEQLILRNIGNGPALYVKVEDIEFDTGLTPGKNDHVAKFATTDVIEGKREVTATAKLFRQMPGGGTKVLSDFLSFLHPDFQKNDDLPVVIDYQDLNGGSHQTRLEMGKNGTRFIRFESGGSQ